jgi:hypothetical protein
MLLFPFNAPYMVLFVGRCAPMSRLVGSVKESFRPPSNLRLGPSVFVNARSGHLVIVPPLARYSATCCANFALCFSFSFSVGRSIFVVVTS